MFTCSAISTRLFTFKVVLFQGGEEVLHGCVLEVSAETGFGHSVVLYLLCSEEGCSEEVFTALRRCSACGPLRKLVKRLRGCQCQPVMVQLV